ncbi:hypothetical protein E4L95_03185 [Paracoccus liaowanqingii]|uniref:Uncharacterized protein n=1 Tax=Paracoccus liaowanqingii TaxID=2560053 RepID=A0A4Z1CS03_9RHOB|nr:hypothetical protein [Paracoccus liaowanqingii]TGN67951.1 hypothetical protein E4L95_03185 [Paracoccus liaowanqingii]
MTAQGQDAADGLFNHVNAAPGHDLAQVNNHSNDDYLIGGVSPASNADLLKKAGLSLRQARVAGLGKTYRSVAICLTVCKGPATPKQV